MESTNIPKSHRLGDSATCQKIWDAIQHIRQDKKSASAENIIRFVNKNYNVAEKNVERELQRLVTDGLITEKKAVATKGSQKGAEQTIYSIASKNEINLKTTHDWYCFKCHKAGEVIACTNCPRVYHINCIGKTENSWDNYVCKACQDCTKNETSHLEQGEINHILSFVVARLEDSFPMNLYLWNPTLTSAIYATSFSTDRCVTLAHRRQKQNTDLADKSENWRAEYLLRQEANLAKMNSRADRQVYKNFEQFRLDVRTIVHNVSIFHGEHSPTADTARLLLKKCLKELEEAKLCNDCYRRSNEQEADGWFCEPCDPPHDLVFAKAKGYPFWPAKVLSIVSDKYDVRFFGGAHDRSKIDKAYIRPITANNNELVTKRSSPWKEAMKELEQHQKLLAQLSDSEDDAESPDFQPEASPSEGHVEKKIVHLKDCAVTVDRNNEIDRIAKFYRDELRTTMETVDQLRNEIALLKTAHSDEISKLKQEIARVEAERDRAVADANIDADLNKKIKEDYEMKLTEAEKRHEEQMKQMKIEHENMIQPLKRNNEEYIEKIKKECHEQLQSMETSHKEHNEAIEKQNKNLVEVKMEELKKEFEQKIKEIQLDHEERLKAVESSHEEKLKEMKQDCQREVETNKKKQWCAQCGKEGAYHCCLGISYCSTVCQHEHWNVAHKRTCVRKKEKHEQRKDLTN